MHRRLLSTLILLAATLIVALPVAAQDGGIEIVGGDEESLRAFLERFLMPIYATGGGQQGQVIIGALPDDLEFDLPLPEGAQVIGSLAPAGAPLVSVNIYFDAPQPAEEVIAFYEETMPESGWRSVTAYQPQGGFTTAAPQGATFCSSDDEQVMNVVAVAGEAEMTPVVIYVQEAYAGACDTDPRAQGINPLIPSLVAPAGTQMRSGMSGGGSEGTSYISATLTTDAGIDELSAHYGDQLAEAGWEAVEETVGASSAVSTWQITDEGGDSWLGVLVLASGGDDTVTSLFQVTQIE